MDRGVLITQLIVGGIAAIVFLSAVVDGIVHHEALLIARKREWDRERRRLQREEAGLSGFSVIEQDDEESQAAPAQSPEPPAAGRNPG